MTKNEAAQEKHEQFARRSAAEFKELFPYMGANNEIWEALQVALADPQGSTALAMKDIHQHRNRGDQLVEQMRVDPVATAEEILALTWETI